MLFSSIPFLFYFIPCMMLVYFLVPAKCKNAVLLAFSIFFYAWGGVTYALLMILAIIMGYVAGRLIERFRGTGKAKAVMILAIIAIISFMLYFKYTDFFIDNFNRLTGLSIPLLRITLPIGISFYTFQIISYVVDVYRGVPAQKNPIYLGAYVSMFPQLIAGPIVRYVDVARELEHRTHTAADAAAGIRRFMMGLAKKILIANPLSELSNIVLASDEPSVLFYWIYGISVALYIYFDFSGYSDMAIGLGRVFGFHYLENFNYPFISRSATEFWRRWHMSLGSWFRDYVYIPLGGNRVSKGRWLFNIFVVWMLTGFWHGAAWNFIIWGLFFGILLTVEKLWLLKHLEKSHVWSRIYLLFAVMVSFIVFNAADMPDAFATIGGLFGAGGIPLVSAEAIYYLRSYGIIFILALVGATPVVKNFASKLETSPKTGRIINTLEPVVLVALLLVITGYLVDGSFNPFLYFRF
ncbi:MAG: MBOAT family protein [Ruminococcaceae bacterium]|nr:MBOAT family protein [Oscillospiraceae bacterium]